jgi:hypothetical protein
MAVAVMFTPSSMNASQYDQIIRQLEQAGASSQKDRLYHVCFGSGNHMQVMDIWTSAEAFEQFGATLMPILQRLGIDPGQPAVSSVHNIIAGA